MNIVIQHSPQKLFRLRRFVYELFGEENGYETLAIVLADNEQDAQVKFSILLKKCGEFHDFEIKFGNGSNLSIDEFESWDVGKSMWWIGENFY